MMTENGEREVKDEKRRHIMQQSEVQMDPTGAEPNCTSKDLT